MRINASDFNSDSFRANATRQFFSPSQVSARANEQKADKTKDIAGDKNKGVKSNGLQDILTSIAERRQGIIDRKKELVDNTIENGGDMNSITETLKMYDMQLKNLEKEKQTAIAQELAKAQEENKPDKVEETQKVEKPKTEEEKQTEALNETAAKISRFDTVTSSKEMIANMKSRVKTLEGEMKVDGINRDEYVRNIIYNKGVAPADMPAGTKEAEIAKLNATIEKLTKSSTKELAKTNKELNSDKVEKPTDPKDNDKIEAEAVANVVAQPAAETDSYA